MNKGFLLTHRVIGMAIENALIVMERTAKNTPLFNDCKHFHIVVMDPTQPYDPNECFEEAIIYEYTLDNGQKYKGFARSKAKTARRCRMTTSYIIEHYPDLLKEGDTIYPGGVYDKGLVVAVSGTNPEFDELFARMIIDQCRAIIRLQMSTIQRSTIEYLGDKIVSVIWDHNAKGPDFLDAVYHKLGSITASLGCNLEIFPQTEMTIHRAIESYKQRFNELRTQNILLGVMVMITPHMFDNSPEIVPVVNYVIEECFGKNEGRNLRNSAFPLIPVLCYEDSVVEVISQKSFNKIGDEYLGFEDLRTLKPLELKRDSWKQVLYDLLQSRLQEPTT